VVIIKNTQTIELEIAITNTRTSVKPSSKLKALGAKPVIAAKLNNLQILASLTLPQSSRRSRSWIRRRLMTVARVGGPSHSKLFWLLGMTTGHCR
jgi:hypothetical protein